MTFMGVPPPTVQRELDLAYEAYMALQVLHERQDEVVRLARMLDLNRYGCLCIGEDYLLDRLHLALDALGGEQEAPVPTLTELEHNFIHEALACLDHGVTLTPHLDRLLDGLDRERLGGH